MFSKILHTYKNAFSGLSKENWLLSLVLLINRLGTMVAVFMSVYVTNFLHRSISEAGLVITLFGIGAVLGSLSGGVLIKKIGFRATQISTSISTGLLYLLFSQIENFYFICILAVLIGLVGEAFRPANFTAIAHYSKPEMMTKSYSLNRFAVNLGMGLGTGLGGIIAAINYQLLFIVEGLANILAGVLILLLLPSAKSTFEKIKEKVNQISKPKSPWKDVRYMRFMLIILLYISSFLVVFKFVPVFWKDEKHINEALIGGVLALNGILIAIFEMVLIQHLQTKNRDVFYIFMGIIFAAASFATLLIPVYPILVAIISILLLTVSEMFALPFINTYVVNASDTESRGSYASVYTLTWSLSGILAPLLGAFIADHFGYDILWVALVTICLVSAFVIKYNASKSKNSTA